MDTHHGFGNESGSIYEAVPCTTIIRHIFLVIVVFVSRVKVFDFHVDLLVFYQYDSVVVRTSSRLEVDTVYEAVHVSKLVGICDLRYTVLRGKSYR